MLTKREVQVLELEKKCTELEDQIRILKRGEKVKELETLDKKVKRMNVVL